MKADSGGTTTNEDSEGMFSNGTGVWSEICGTRNSMNQGYKKFNSMKDGSQNNSNKRDIKSPTSILSIEDIDFLSHDHRLSMVHGGGGSCS